MCQVNCRVSSSKTKRLFLALALPAPVRKELAALATPLAGVTWTHPEQLHLTLRFLGDVAEEKMERVIEHLATVRVEPFILPVEGVGAFPLKSPPRTLWVGVGRGHPHLHQLRQRIDDALLAAGLLELDVRTFHPHITLARATEKAAPALARWIRSKPDFVGPPFRVSAFDLMASELQPAGAIHTLVEKFELIK
jgi:2'-5' RNA ligase